MSLDLNTQTTVPSTFVRGQTLEFVLVLPPTIPAAFFTDAGNGISTALGARLRLKDQAGDAGFVCNLNPTWEPDQVSVRCTVIDTDNFPLGPAEFDVLFTKTKSGEGGYTKKYRSLPIEFTIIDGVT